MWRVVDNYVMSMPSQFVQAKREFQEEIIGVQEYQRWSYCLESMMKPLEMTLGRLYVDANFDESTKTTVRCNFDEHSSGEWIGSLLTHICTVVATNRQTEAALASVICSILTAIYFCGARPPRCLEKSLIIN